MQSSTTNDMQCWPPTNEIIEDDGTIKSCDLVLPEALYWDFIRPFTPVKDRAIINKRTGSTQFYAGARIPLDLDYLVRFGESGSWHGGDRPRALFKPSDCETFEITLPPKDEFHGMILDCCLENHSSYCPILNTIERDDIKSQIPVRHHNSKSWVVKIGKEGESLVNQCKEVAHHLLDSSQTDTSSTISITLCNIKSAKREMPDIFEHLPNTEGEPGSSGFRLKLEVTSENSVPTITEPNKALVALQKVRDSWDMHLSLIPSPSARLHACLSLLHDNTNSTGYYLRCRLLFPGDGSIKDLVNFHASMNKMSIKGPPIAPAFPNTQLGYWAGNYLCAYMKDLQNETYKYEPELLTAIVFNLAEAGADVEEFYEPMDIYPEDAIISGDSVVSNDMISVLSALRGFEQLFSQDMSIAECLKCYFDTHRDDINLRGLVGLVGCLDHHMKFDCSALRFSVGDRVECLVSEGWLPGTIRKQWCYDGRFGFKFPYLIDLDGRDEDENITAPFDCESVIRSPRPDLRFDIGTRVLCNMDHGWKEGTVTGHWHISNSHREQPRNEIVHHPYRVALDESPDISFVAFYDQDESILALSEDSDEDEDEYGDID